MGLDGQDGSMGEESQSPPGPEKPQEAEETREAAADRRIARSALLWRQARARRRTRDRYLRLIAGGRLQQPPIQPRDSTGD